MEGARSLMATDAAPMAAVVLVAQKTRPTALRRRRLITEQARRRLIRRPTASDARPTRPIRFTALPHCSTPPRQCKRRQMGALRQHQIPRGVVQRALRSEVPHGAHQARTRGVRFKRTSFVHTPRSSTGLWTQWHMAAEAPGQSLGCARATIWCLILAMGLRGVPCSRLIPWVVPAMLNLPRMAPRVTAGQRTACRARKASAAWTHPTGQDQTVQDQTACMVKKYPSTQAELTSLIRLHPDRLPLFQQTQRKVSQHMATWHVLAPLQPEQEIRRPGLF
mmetsp:Transcript_49148/g.97675  ORF Transcript_49148/g.97675 Transcript_49148/m.97675 type:complete len:278 (-) Transcript_49148:1839-2672(-)